MQRIITSPAGYLTLSAHGGVLTAADWGMCVETAAAASAQDRTVLDTAAKQLDEYFAGTRRTFDLPLAPSGTAFQLAVWDYLRTIPYGETRTYGDIARAIGKPGASRAVGMACHTNPISVIVPCHRVVGKAGLTGYAGGLHIKKALLTLEGIL